MSKKLLFFDIDGTLIAFDGTFPESAKTALKKAQENGHEIFLCSGRNRCQIDKLLSDFGFDGMVTSAGANVEYHGKVIFDHFMATEDYKKLVSYFEKHQMAYMVQCSDKIVMTVSSRDRIRESFRMYRKRIVGDEVFPSQVLDDDYEGFATKYPNAEKACYFMSDTPVSKIASDLSHMFDVTKMSYNDGTDKNGEITQKGITKAVGMEKMAEYLGLTRDDVIAFGDGQNDFEMMEYAGYAVAMGNAIDALKQRADYITTDVKDDGISHALEYLKLIG